MKNKQVTAMLMAMAFSAATMSSCGVYGGSEAAVPDAAETENFDPSGSDQEIIDVYGPAEMEVTEAAVYGPLETYETIEEDGSIDDTTSLTWENQMTPKDGFADADKTDFRFGGIFFPLPDYLEEEPSEDPEQYASFLAEETDTDFARLEFRKEIVEIPDGDYESYLNGIHDEFLEDDRLVREDNRVMADNDAFIYCLHERVNGVLVAYYYAHLVHEIDDGRYNLVTVCFTTTEGCEYNYRTDFMQILENASQIEDRE